MEAILKLPKKGDKVFTIDRCKIEIYYVESVKFHRKPDYDAYGDLSQDIEVGLEKYNNGVDSFKTTKRLSDIFLTKDELLKQL
jgi:hypothetical protein